MKIAPILVASAFAPVAGVVGWMINWRTPPDPGDPTFWQLAGAVYIVVAVITAIVGIPLGLTVSWTLKKLGRNDFLSFVLSGLVIGVLAGGSILARSSSNFTGEFLLPAAFTAVAAAAIFWFLEIRPTQPTGSRTDA